MVRSLSLFLLLIAAVGFAPAAFAVDAAPARTPDANCPKSDAEHDDDSAPATTKASRRPSSTVPVRERAGGAGSRGTPRWHSLLPGMVR